MNKYRSYMDRVTVSDELHEKLLHLEKPAKKPLRWPKYTAAACAVLLVGAGAWSIGTRVYEERWRAQLGPYGSFEPYAVVEPAPAEATAGYVPGIRTIGGYEERIPWRGQELVKYHVLPWIDYGSANEAAAVALDWDIPADATRRDLSEEEIVNLLGGEDAVDLHLDWSAYELTGWGAWYEDGSFWGAYLQGYKGPMDHFEFAVTAGDLPPICIVFEGSVEQDIWGVTVTADKYDGEGGCARRVSFMEDGYGYRFDLTATGETEDAEKLVSRVVSYVAEWDGLSLYTLTGEEPPEVEAEPDWDSESQAPSPPPQDGVSAPSIPPFQDGASAPSVPPAGLN